MMKMASLKHILVVSENKAFSDSIKMILPPDEFDITFVESGQEARRMIINQNFEILIINSPLPDEHGISFAEDYIYTTMGILLVCPNETFDLIAAQGEELGIVVLAANNPPAFIYIAVKMIASMRKRLESFEKKTRTLQEKMTDIRTINKAKWALIGKKKMSEEEAHKYIEKIAMNRRISSREAADEILEILED